VGASARKLAGVSPLEQGNRTTLHNKGRGAPGKEVSHCTKEQSARGLTRGKKESSLPQTSIIVQETAYDVRHFFDIDDEN
jgi:hypothetical protein